MFTATIRNRDPLARLQANLRKKKIPGLDGLRGIAALSVLGLHDQVMSHRDALGRIFVGRFGVQIFFVISGFLITWLLLQEEQKDGTVNRAAFYWRRAFRLLPGLFAYLLWQYFHRPPFLTRAGMIAAALYFSNYYQIIRGTLGLQGLGHTWSLAVEEHFYLIWPQVFLFVHDRRKLLRGCLMVAALQVVWRLAAGFRGELLYAEFSTETASAAVLIGCSLGLVLWYLPHRLPRFLLHRGMTPVCLAVIVGLGQLSASAQLWWGIPLGVPCTAILVLQAITYDGRLLNNPVALFLGRISYSVYLWAYVAIIAIQHFGHDRFHLPAFAAAIVLGSASYYLIEHPIQILGLKWLSRLKTVGGLPPIHWRGRHAH